VIVREQPKKPQQQLTTAWAGPAKTCKTKTCKTRANAWHAAADSKRHDEVFVCVP